MAGGARDRQRKDRQAKAAAAAAARRRAARQRRLLRIGVGGAAVVAIVLFVVLTQGGGKKSQKVQAGSTSTSISSASSSTTAAGSSVSAAGKPCAPLSDPLPSGAPAVPVKVGPPPTQLVKDDLKPGAGEEVKPGATVTVNYIGVSCSTGKIFDSSYSRGQPVSFPLGQVIKGWQDGIPGMKVGGRRLLGIPPDLAYGSQAQPGIAPGETLWFVVEVLATKAS